MRCYVNEVNLRTLLSFNLNSPITKLKKKYIELDKNVTLSVNIYDAALSENS